MFLTDLNLINFRSFKKKAFQFSSNTSLLVGQNASGKTNVLEAIHLLAIGRSFRASLEAEMINYNQEVCLIKSKLQDGQILEIILTNGDVQGKKVAKKLYKINGVSKRWRDFFGNLRVVLFRPEDIDIILGSPSQRRKYLDSVLEQVDWQYRAANIAYLKALRQRNKLLTRIREQEAYPSQLTFWNQLLIKNGQYISEKRQEFIEYLNSKLKDELEIYYDKSLISQARLEKYSQAELALGATLVGPHRDEIKFEVDGNKRNLALYGSRGEQRMAIITMKLQELEFLFEKTKNRPVLLLDDIFSELDKNHRNKIIKIIPKQQTIITTTDINLIDKDLSDKIEVIRIGNS